MYEKTIQYLTEGLLEPHTLPLKLSKALDSLEHPLRLTMPSVASQELLSIYTTLQSPKDLQEVEECCDRLWLLEEKV